MQILIYLFILLGVVLNANAEDQKNKSSYIYFEANPEKIKNYIVRIYDINEYLQEIKGITVSQKPKITSLRTINDVYVHPNFLTTINIDGGFVIKGNKFSFKTKTAEIVNNTLYFQVSDDFVSGNIVLFLQNIETKERYVITIFVKRYKPFSKKQDLISPLYLVYNFVDKKFKKPIEVLERYYALKHKYPDKPVIFYIENQGYYIIPDKKYGTIRVGKRAYLINPVQVEK